MLQTTMLNMPHKHAATWLQKMAAGACTQQQKDVKGVAACSRQNAAYLALQQQHFYSKQQSVQGAYLVAQRRAAAVAGC
jgi:hypothetical protein